MKPQPKLDSIRPSRWLASGILAAAFCATVAADEPQPANAPVDLSLRILNWDETQELIRTKYSGRVVVVDLWTNTCGACLEGYPEFAALQDRFGRDEFACVSLNCDYDGIPGKPPAYYRPRVVEFLKRQPGGVDHVMLSEPLLDFMEKIKLDSTPALFVFGPDGRLVQRFDNDHVESDDDAFTMEQVEAAVRKLLK